MSSSHGTNPCKKRLDAETILVAQLRGRSQQASESQVKSHLKEEANTVATKPENSLVYANVRGFGMLENLENLMRKVDNQTRELEKLRKESQSEIKELKNGARVSKRDIDQLTYETRVSKNQIETLESEARESKTEKKTQDLNLLALEGRVTNLTSTSQGYLDIRMRFLDNYNKKVKRDPAFQKTQAIEIGNDRAHGGDAKVDATLFRDQKRLEDPGTYKELYGVDHSMALKLCTYLENQTDIFTCKKLTIAATADTTGDGQIEGLIFRVLNARATQVAQKRPFSKELENAFKHYVASLGQAGCRKACLTFWKMYNEEYSVAG